MRSLGIFYRDTKRIQDAETAYREALALDRRANWGAAVADDLDELALLHEINGQLQQAAIESHEAILIRRRLRDWLSDPATASDLAQSLMEAALASANPSDACDFEHQAEKIFPYPAKKLTNVLPEQLKQRGKRLVAGCRQNRNSDAVDQS